MYRFRAGTIIFNVKKDQDKNSIFLSHIITQNFKPYL